MAFQRSGVEGAKELDQALAELATQVATRLGVRANRKAAVALQKKLAETAPFRPGERLHNGKNYGHIRTSVKVRKARSQKANFAVHEITTGDAFWAVWYEMGNSNQPARPWWRPTTEAAKDELIQVQIAELGKGIERIAKGVAKGKLAANGTRL